MTPKELYDWAVESGCENYDIKNTAYPLLNNTALKIRAFIDGWGDIASDIEELGIVKKERPKMIIIDINNQ